MRIQIRKEILFGKVGWNAYEVDAVHLPTACAKFIPATSFVSADDCEARARAYLQLEASEHLPWVEREFDWPPPSNLKVCSCCATHPGVCLCCNQADAEAQALDDAAAEGECFSEALRRDNPVR